MWLSVNSYCCRVLFVLIKFTGLQEHKSYTMCNTTTGPSSTKGHHRPRTTHSHQSSLSMEHHIRYNRNTIQLCPQHESYVEDEDEKYSKMQKQLRAQRRTYLVVAAAVLITGYAGIYWGVTSAFDVIEANNRRSVNRPQMQHERHHPVVASAVNRRRRRPVPATVSPKLRAHFLEDTMTISFAKRKQLQRAQAGEDGGGVLSWFLGLFGLSYGRGSNHGYNGPSLYTYNDDTLQASLNELEMSIESNSHTNTFHWLNSKQPNSLLPSLDIARPNILLDQLLGPPRSKYDLQTPYFKVKREDNTSIPMEWEDDYERHHQEHKKEEEAREGKTSARRSVDYTQLSYAYPTLPKDITSVLEDEDGSGSGKKMANYPPLRPLREIFDTWPQDQLDTPPIQMLQETLYHFDYNDPEQMKQALTLRDQKLPFKVVNVPDLMQANIKWTDEYLSEQFDQDRKQDHEGLSSSSSFTTPSTSTCQESSTNFFLHYQPSRWNVEYMGLPPTRENDWTFEKWSQHAKYADLVGLGPEQPHYYYHGGVSREERSSFISNDLPCFSASATSAGTTTTTSAPGDDPNGGGTFFIFSPRDSNGIQCRFGERGVTAAIHYDGGRNMVGMVTVSVFWCTICLVSG